MYKKGQIKLSDVGRCLGRFSRPLYQSQNLHTVADVRYCREKTHLLNSVVVLLSEVMANWFQVWSREEFPPKTQLFVREHLSLRISRTGLSKYRQHNKTFLHLHFPRKKSGSDHGWRNSHWFWRLRAKMSNVNQYSLEINKKLYKRTTHYTLIGFLMD